MASLADVTDVTDVYGDLTPLQTSQVTAWLARLSAVVRLRYRTIDARIAASPDLDVVTRGVLVDAVLRVLRNPDGRVSETIDDYTYRRADSVADGTLYLTDAEWLLLAPIDASQATATGAFSVRPTGQPDGPRRW